MTNEEARRTSGRKMEEGRRASDRAFREDLNALAQPDRSRGSLPTIPRRGGMSAARGIANWVAPKSSGGGGGIESPLTEGPYAEREYYEGSYFLSTDLLMAIELKPLKRISMTDAAGNDVVLDFAEPI